jgi:hypothetical protein
MSVRHFNYTQRQRILHTHTSIKLVRHDEAASFDADLRLHDYSFPGSASVVVEAYRQTILRRFSFGTVANPRPTGGTALASFSDVDALLFRVKVVEPTTGLLLGEADRIKPVDPDGGERPSFLAVRGESLSGEAWKLDFSDDHPVLLVEKSYGPYQSLLASPNFRWLVLPQVFRSLLEKAVTEDLDEVLDESSETWQSAVVLHARILTDSNPPLEDDQQDRDDWIARAVGAFCRKHSLAQRYHADVFQGTEP